MIRKNWLLCVLLGTLAWGQAAPNAPAPSQPAQAPAEQEGKPQPPTPAPGTPAPTPAAPEDRSASVPANAPVLTIEGVCPGEAKTTAASGKAAAGTKAGAAKTASAGCKTVITKAQFEKLAESLVPNVTPQVKKQLAGLLPRLMAMSEDAKKQGLDKTSEYNERVKFVKMQVLSQALQQQIQKKAADIPQPELEQYYKEHPDTFEQYNIDRIFVPRTKQIEPEAKSEEDKNEKLTDEQQKAKEAEEKAKAEEGEQAMSKLAEQLRTRAAAGEDFAKLQKEAFEAAGMKIESPTVNLPNVRRTGLPPGHAAVFDVKPGEVSQVISDSGGHYIYKVISKSELPFEQVKNEIHSKMQNDRMRDMMEKVNNSFKVESNEAYFGPGGMGAMPPPPHMPRPRPGAPAGGYPQNQAPAQPPAAKPN